MNRQPSITDRLIAYWTSRGEGGENSDPLCREITRELTGLIPRPLLAILQSEPQRHREAIDEMVRDQLGLTTTPACRDLNGTVPAPPAPRRPALTEPIPTLRRPSPAQSELDDSPSARQDRKRVSTAPYPSIKQGDSSQVITTGDVGTINNQVSTPGGKGYPEKSPREDPPDPDALIRILFLGANPADSSPLRLDHEVREIDHSLTSAALGHRFELHQKWAVRVSDLQSHLLRSKPQILHFSGHGSHQKGIVLEGEDGTSRLVAGVHLARLLGQFNQNLRCVVLNACYSEEQAQAIVQEVDCVVGMSTAVADRAAVRFAARFYEALAYGKDVRAAFEMARSDIEINELGQEAVPHLLARRRAAETIRFAAPAR